MKTNKVPIPTRSFDIYDDITLQVLSDNGIKGILTDLDDTIVTHNYPITDERSEKWFNMLETNGIKLCIISNNRKKRILSFVRNLNVGYFCNSFKPAVHNIESALAVMNIKKEEAVFIGDQLFTDIRAANNAGIRSFLVTPRGNKATLFIKFKRMLERKITK